MGPNHPAVLGTLDSLAETFVAANRGKHALQCFSLMLERLNEQEESTRDQRAMVLFKMSKVHLQTDDIQSQINKLHAALKVLRSEADVTETGQELEQMIQMDLRASRQAMEQKHKEWV